MGYYSLMGHSPDGLSFVVMHPDSLTFYRLDDGLNLSSAKIEIPLELMRGFTKDAVTWTDDNTEIIIRLEKQIVLLDALNGKIKESIILKKSPNSNGSISSVVKVNSNLYLITYLINRSGRDHSLFAVNAKGNELWPKEIKKEFNLLKSDKKGNYSIAFHNIVWIINPTDGSIIETYTLPSTVKKYCLNKNYLLALTANEELILINLNDREQSHYSFISRPTNMKILDIALDPEKSITYFSAMTKDALLMRWDPSQKPKSSKKLVSIPTQINPYLSTDPYGNISFEILNHGLYLFAANGDLHLRSDPQNTIYSNAVWNAEMDLWILFDSRNSKIRFLRGKPLNF